jgi:hypothetical protein
MRATISENTLTARFTCGISHRLQKSGTSSIRRNLGLKESSGSGERGLQKSGKAFSSIRRILGLKESSGTGERRLQKSGKAFSSIRRIGTEGVNWADDARYERSADLDMKSMDETVKTEETREEWMDYPARSPYWWDHRRRKPRIPELNLPDGKWLDGMWGHLRGTVDIPKGISTAGAWDPHALTSDETE